MQKIVFYSWQSDLKNKTNRGFIQDALEVAASKIRTDETVNIEPVIDRDTKGVAGAPDIASTIFAKISSSDVFVADISIVCKQENGRSIPNPNVLIELGYAMKALGHERIILVFNKSYGNLNELPFDLKTRRILTYEYLGNNTEDGSKLKSNLALSLEQSLKTALQTHLDRSETTSLPSLDAIEQQAPNKIILLRKDLEKGLQKIGQLKPKVYEEVKSLGKNDEELILLLEESLEDSLRQSQEIVAEISKLLSVTVIMSDKDSLLEIYRSLGKLFELYNQPYGFSGTYGKGDFDFFRFIGHEVLVTMVANLVREEKWGLLKEILDEQIPVNNLAHSDGPGLVNWDYAYNYTFLLDQVGRKRNRSSLHADLLKSRHSEGGLAEVMPFQDFMEADFFLYLLTLSNGQKRWFPPSIVYLSRTPLFLKKAEKLTVAKKVLDVFNKQDISTWKSELTSNIPNINKLFPFSSWGIRSLGEDISKVGST